MNIDTQAHIRINITFPTAKAHIQREFQYLHKNPGRNFSKQAKYNFSSEKHVACWYLGRYSFV